MKENAIKLIMWRILINKNLRVEYEHAISLFDNKISIIKMYMFNFLYNTSPQLTPSYHHKHVTIENVFPWLPFVEFLALSM